MTTIMADKVEINIEDGKWRLYNLEGANSLSPFFYTVRGTRLLYYVVRFGEARQLPGDVLSADYVKAVVVGFDEKSKRWLLGLQVQLTETEKPRFVELVHWPEGDEEQAGADGHKAGRILAEYIGCPLKLFGVKKATAAQSTATGTLPRVTGPLEPHRRVDIEPQRARLKAEAIPLPISAGGLWLGAMRNGYTLRISKEAEQSKEPGEAPAYNQCVIDKESQTVRLMPQTGLLGAFLGPQGRSIKFSEVRNVELRHSLLHESSTRKDEDGLDVDITKTKELFGIYLTLADESLLLAQLQHVATSELTRHRAKTKTLMDGDFNAENEMAYLRLHQREQKRHDEAVEFTESTAYVIAGAINRPLVKTEVGEEPV